MQLMQKGKALLRKEMCTISVSLPLFSFYSRPFAVLGYLYLTYLLAAQLRHAAHSIPVQAGRGVTSLFHHELSKAREGHSAQVQCGQQVQKQAGGVGGCSRKSKCSRKCRSRCPLGAPSIKRNQNSKADAHSLLGQLHGVFSEIIQGPQ